MRKSTRKGPSRKGDLVTSMPALTRATPKRASTQGEITGEYPWSFGVGSGGKSPSRRTRKPRRSRMY